jgi:hypothetical protein
MIIPNETIKAWKAIQEPGDIDKLAKKLNLQRRAVFLIFEKSKTSTENVRIINKFYRSRFLAQKKNKNFIDND